jgi:HEPN domain-containing protein
MDRAVAYWVRISRRDIGSAAVLFQAGDTDNALFLCQQAVEKALKALVQTTLDDPPPKIHSLMRLAVLAGVWDEMEPERQAKIHAVDPYVTAGRYPPAEAQLSMPASDEELQRILSDCREMVEWLLAHLT